MVRSRNGGDKCTILYDRQQNIDQGKFDRNQKFNRILGWKSGTTGKFAEKWWKKQDKKGCSEGFIKRFPAISRKK